MTFPVDATAHIVFPVRWYFATGRLGGINERPPGLPVKQYISGAWQQIGVLKAHDGTDWVKPKVWNGAEWV